MNINKRFIVGIKGRKGSGKDTVASMIHYIIAAGTTQANFDDWKKYDKSEKDDLDVPTRHFADKIKDDLSFIFGINRECFDNSDYKDNKYYLFQNKTFTTLKEQKDNPRAEITLKDLQENTLAKWRESYGDNCVIKLRTLMQYYGTELIRHNIGSQVWVDGLIQTAIKDKNYYGYAVIADARYPNEVNAIYNVGGKVIHVFKTDNTKVEHSSEDIKCDTRDYEIDNNSTLLGLFYKVLEFIKEEMM